MSNLEAIDWPRPWPEAWWRHFTAAATRFFNDKGLSISQLTYTFHTDDGLNKVNREHLQHDDYTDIITFDYSRGKRLRGEIHISAERIEDNAATFHTELRLEVFRVMVHGLLHMTGLKDKTEQEAQAMRQAEAEFLNFAVAFHVEHTS
jgi:rRNA maturation RNase YbeY